MTTTRAAARRTDALSPDRIVVAAAAILDEGGEAALTFRSLATALSTGPGALYHHVADKDALLAACTDHVVTSAVPARLGSDPRDAVRTTALAVYDAIETHPWVGTELARRPGHPAMLPVVEVFGSRLGEMGLTGEAQFDAATALLAYLLGLAAQQAAAARMSATERDRDAFLTSVADRWAALDPVAYPFLHGAADRLPGHDDRTQFLAGIDLLLAGVTARDERAG